MINKIARTQNSEQSSLESLNDFFKDVDNNQNHDKADTEIQNTLDLTNNDTILNAKISIDEIERVIRSLKNNKPSAVDDVIY